MLKDHDLYVGTYGPFTQETLFHFHLSREDASLKKVDAYQGIPNPSYLCVSSDKKYLYADIEEDTFLGHAGGAAAAFAVHEDGLELLNLQFTQGRAPCHVLLDEERRFLFTANYNSGSLTMFPLREDHCLDPACCLQEHHGRGPNPARQEGPHVHFNAFAPDHEGIYDVDLGLDRIFYYAIDAQKKCLRSVPERDLILPAGSGPRHLAFLKSQPYLLYVLSELSSEVFVFDLSQKDAEHGCRILQRISARQGSDPADRGAAIKFSEDGRFLYTSVRGEDTAAVFAVKEDGSLEGIQLLPAGGENPRDLTVVEDMVLTACQDTNNIACFRRDPATGLLSYASSIPCSSPVCLVDVPCE